MSEEIAVLQMEHVAKTYYQGDNPLCVLADAHFKLLKGEIVALVGPSGSGKSTLLQIMGLLDQMDQGRLTVVGKPCHHLNDHGRTMLRRRYIGFVYQMHHLLPDFTALENAEMPLLIDGITDKSVDFRAEALLKEMGLGDRLKHRPSELSGGEQQRVAIARALVHRPEIILADEPTGNLDVHTAEQVFEILLTTIRAHQMAGLIVTHNMDLAKQTDRIVTLQDGKIVLL